jgi:hypothetical protein
VPAENKKYLNLLQSNDHKITAEDIRLLIKSYICIQCGENGDDDISLSFITVTNKLERII